MIEKIALNLTEWMIKLDVIKKNDKTVYLYGVEILTSTVINILLLIFIGAIFQKVPQTIFFICCFSFVKRYSGGYHASTYWNCILTFSGLYFIILLTLHTLNLNEANLYFPLVWFICTCIIIQIVPVVDKNKEMTIEEITKARRKCLSNYFAISIVLFVIYKFMNNQREFVLYGVVALIEVSLVALAGHIHNKRI